MNGIFANFLMILLLVFLTAGSGCNTIINHYGGNFKGEPSEMWDAISGKHADTLIRKAFEFKKYASSVESVGNRRLW
jgi:hypothetical protein